MSQIVEEFCFSSPADFSLETSRPGGAPLSALASLYSSGIEGFQRNLANLISNIILLKNELKQQKDFFICNPNSLGFVAMLRIYPPESKNDSRRFLEIKNQDNSTKAFVIYVNKYMKQFFEWDFKSRIIKNKGIEYSFSGAYIKLRNNEELSAIKIYPTSPHFSKKQVQEIATTLIKQKKIFDKEIWKNETKNFSKNQTNNA